MVSSSSCGRAAAPAQRAIRALDAARDGARVLEGDVQPGDIPGGGRVARRRDLEAAGRADDDLRALDRVEDGAHDHRDAAALAERVAAAERRRAVLRCGRASSGGTWLAPDADVVRCMRRRRQRGCRRGGARGRRARRRGCAPAGRRPGATRPRRRAGRAAGESARSRTTTIGASRKRLADRVGRERPERADPEQPDALALVAQLVDDVLGGAGGGAEADERACRRRRAGSSRRRRTAGRSAPAYSPQRSAKNASARSIASACCRRSSK